MFVAILILIALDILTGIISAIINKKLTSKRSYIGMFKKVSIIAVIIVAGIVEVHLHVPNIFNMVTTFFLITESLSILENVKALGLPIPPFLSNIINSQGKEDDDKNDTK